jgi:hypothetical protein
MNTGCKNPLHRHQKVIGDGILYSFAPHASCIGLHVKCGEVISLVFDLEGMDILRIMGRIKKRIDSQ